MSLKINNNSNVAQRVIGTGGLLAIALSLTLAGCQKKETLLEAKGPGGEIKVERVTDHEGHKTIEVEKKEIQPVESTPSTTP